MYTGYFIAAVLVGVWSDPGIALSNIGPNSASNEHNNIVNVHQKGYRHNHSLNYRLYNQGYTGNCDVVFGRLECPQSYYYNGRWNTEPYDSRYYNERYPYDSGYPAPQKEKSDGLGSAIGDLVDKLF